MVSAALSARQTPDPSTVTPVKNPEGAAGDPIGVVGLMWVNGVRVSPVLQALHVLRNGWKSESGSRVKGVYRR